MSEPALLDGKYRPLRELGRGSAGLVLEAEDVTLGRRIALKIGPIEPAIMKTRFLREGRAAAQLQSRHVAHVHRVGELPDGRPYIVMDLLVGRTVADVLAAEGPIDPKRAVGWMLEALDALAEAHEIGLVHRDVKPGNLHLTERAGRPPIVKVLDFGLAKDAHDTGDERITRTGDAFGTPTYVAPEQVRDASRSDARTDVWGIGVTLYELLAGRPPFVGDSVKSLLEAIATAPMPPLPRVPSRLEAIVRRCLAKAPADRYENGRALAKALEELLPRTERRGRSALFIASSAGGMAIAGAIAFAAWPRERPHALLRPSRSIALTLPPVAETESPILPTASGSAASPAPSRPPMRIGTKGGYGIVLASTAPWIASILPKFQKCVWHSACAGKRVTIVVPARQEPYSLEDECRESPAALACLAREIPPPRVFADSQGPEAEVIVGVY